MASAHAWAFKKKPKAQINQLRCFEICSDQKGPPAIVLLPSCFDRAEHFELYFRICYSPEPLLGLESDHDTNTASYPLNRSVFVWVEIHGTRLQHVHGTTYRKIEIVSNRLPVIGPTTTRSYDNGMIRYSYSTATNMPYRFSLIQKQALLDSSSSRRDEFSQTVYLIAKTNLLYVNTNLKMYR